MSDTIEIDGKSYDRDRIRGQVKDSYPRLYPQDVDLYIDECLRRGVHPLSRLVVPRPNIKKDSRGQYVRGGPPAWIVTIDLMRAKADQTGTYVPGDESKFEYNDKGELVSARAFVRKLVGGQVVMFSESADWEEYCPADGQDSMWRKMPRVMLAKVAEARALRKGWPAQLQGLYEGSEMDQAGPSPMVKTDDDPPTAPIPAAPSPKQPAPVAAAVDPIEDDNKFKQAVANAGIARGGTIESIKEWFYRGLEEQQKTISDFTLDMRHEFIGEIKAGKYDTAIKAMPAPDGDSFREQFVKLAGEMEIDEDGATQAFEKWLMRAGYRKAEDKIPPARREAVLKAMREDRFDYARGQIAPAAMAG